MATDAQGHGRHENAVIEMAGARQTAAPLEIEARGDYQGGGDSCRFPRQHIERNWPVAR
jgi:hypothetical protein